MAPKKNAQVWGVVYVVLCVFFPPTMTSMVYLYLVSLLNTVVQVSYNGQAPKQFVYGHFLEMHQHHDEAPTRDLNRYLRLKVMMFSTHGITWVHS